MSLEGTFAVTAYALVFDLSKPLNDLAQSHFRDSDGSVQDLTNNLSFIRKYGDFLRHWLTSFQIAYPNLISESFLGKNERVQFPAVLGVASRADVRKQWPCFLLKAKHLLIYLLKWITKDTWSILEKMDAKAYFSSVIACRVAVLELRRFEGDWTKWMSTTGQNRSQCPFDGWLLRNRTICSSAVSLLMFYGRYLDNLQVHFAENVVKELVDVRKVYLTPFCQCIQGFLTPS
eukprot:m.10809 g.10809  ORF g.10809 m.10809 type:complete len:232 (+) comp22705_c0_seq1:493-1188(+)